MSPMDDNHEPPTIYAPYMFGARTMVTQQRRMVLGQSGSGSWPIRDRAMHESWRSGPLSQPPVNVLQAARTRPARGSASGCICLSEQGLVCGEEELWRELKVGIWALHISIFVCSHGLGCAHYSVVDLS